MVDRMQSRVYIGNFSPQGNVFVGELKQQRLGACTYASPADIAVDCFSLTWCACLLFLMLHFVQFGYIGKLLAPHATLVPSYTAVMVYDSACTTLDSLKGELSLGQLVILYVANFTLCKTLVP